jgi:outer membrane receptor protein involved in Fe transport
VDFTVHLFEYLKVMANMAYTRGRDTKNEEDLASIPPLSGFLRLQYDSSFGLWGKADALYNASQKHVPDGTESSDDWRRLDLMLGYRFVACGMDHEIYGAVDNVFDKRYCDYLTTSRGYAFNEPGRSCRIGYRMTF